MPTQTVLGHLISYSALLWLKRDALLAPLAMHADAGDCGGLLPGLATVPFAYAKAYALRRARTDHSWPPRAHVPEGQLRPVATGVYSGLPRRAILLCGRSFHLGTPVTAFSSHV